MAAVLLFLMKIFLVLFCNFWIGILFAFLLPILLKFWHCNFDRLELRAFVLSSWGLCFKIWDFFDYYLDGGIFFGSDNLGVILLIHIVFYVSVSLHESDSVLGLTHLVCSFSGVFERPKLILSTTKYQQGRIKLLPPHPEAKIVCWIQPSDKVHVHIYIRCWFQNVMCPNVLNTKKKKKYVFPSKNKNRLW